MSTSRSTRLRAVTVTACNSFALCAEALVRGCSPPCVAASPACAAGAGSGLPAGEVPSVASTADGIARAEMIMPARSMFDFDRVIRADVVARALHWTVMFPS